MVYEHEIPSGSKLYFGASATLKRRIEAIAAETLANEGYEEIVTPLFSYHQHEAFDDTRTLVRLNDAENHEVSLRADSTADVIRIVTKRLGRSSEAKKWFYIQPVVSFATKESYQVGAEELGGSFEATTQTAVRLLEALAIRPLLQLSNMRIPLMLHRTYGIELDALKAMHVEQLERQQAWMQQLIAIESIEDLRDVSSYPEDIARELEALRQAAQAVDYAPMTIAPLYYAKMRYYDGLVFRMIDKHRIVAQGGTYRIDTVQASGFALDVDACIARKMNEGTADE